METVGSIVQAEVVVTSGVSVVDSWPVVAVADPWASSEWVGGFNELRSEVVLPGEGESESEDGASGRYTLLFAAVGCGELRINGVTVTEPLAPGWAAIPEVATLYEAYDVTALLQADGKTNVIGVRVGKCKWAYRGEYCSNMTEAACNAARWELYGPGEWSAVSAANTTEGHNGPIVSDDLFQGEVFDARAEEPGWDRPGFSPPAPWEPAVQMHPMVGGMRMSTAPPMVLGEAMQPVSVKPSPVADAWVVDIGINIAGVCHLTIPASTLKSFGVTAGWTFRMLHGELLNADGSVRNQFGTDCKVNQINCANQTDTYTVSASDLSGGVDYTPTFTYHGFRRVSLQGWPHSAGIAPTADTVVCHKLSNGVQPISTLVSGPGSALAGQGAHDNPAERLRRALADGVQPGSASSVLNAVEASVRVTQTNNLHSHPEDCPSREKRGWMGDAAASAPEAVRFFDMASLYANWLRAHRDQQAFGCLNPTSAVWAGTEVAGLSNNYQCCGTVSRFGCNRPGKDPLNASGFVPDVIPFPWEPVGGWPGDPSWMVASVAVPFEVYGAYGSRQALQDAYPLFSQYLDAVTRPSSYDSRGVIAYSYYGDWLAVDKVADSTLVGTASVLQALTEGISMASILQQPQQHWVEAASRIASAFGTAFRNEHGTFGDGSGVQTANCLAFVQQVPGAGPFANDTGSTAQAVLKDIAARNTTLTGGVVGVRWLLECLEQMGRGDVAVALATQTAAPSWGYFVSDPSFPGTLWEEWENPSGGFSFDHIMFGGGIGKWIHEHAGGLRVSHGLGEPTVREAIAAVAGGSMTAAEASVRLREAALTRTRASVTLQPHGAALRATGSIAMQHDTPLGRVSVTWSLTEESGGNAATIGVEATVPFSACSASNNPVILRADAPSLVHALSPRPLRAAVEVRATTGSAGFGAMPSTGKPLPCGHSSWEIRVSGL